jgi:putative ABC transport system permease protein
MVSGASPAYAGIYQFVVVAMILAASGITALVIALLMRRRAFSGAAQWLWRDRRPTQGQRADAP